MSDLFYRNPRLTLLTIGLIAVAGLAALDALPRQEDPALARRFATITTFYPGASALRVGSGEFPGPPEFPPSLSPGRASPRASRRASGSKGTRPGSSTARGGSRATRPHRRPSRPARGATASGAT